MSAIKFGMDGTHPSFERNTRSWIDDYILARFTQGVQNPYTLQYTSEIRARVILKEKQGFQPVTCYMQVGY